MSRHRPGRWAAMFAAAALAAGLGVGVAGADQRIVPLDDGPVLVPPVPTLKNPPPEDSPPSTGQLDLNEPGPSLGDDVEQFPPILEKRPPQGDDRSDTSGEPTTGGGEGIVRPGDRTIEGPRKRAGGGVGTGGEDEDPLADCTIDDVIDPEELDEDDYILEVIERAPDGQVTLGEATYDGWFDKDTGCILIAGEPDDPGDDTSEPETPTSTAEPEPEEPAVIRGCTPTMWHEPGLPENARPTGELFRFQGGDYALFTDEAVAGEDCWLVPATDEGTTVEHACTVYRLFTVADGQVRIPYGATEVPCRHHEVVETRYELRSVPSGPVTRAGDDAAVAAGRR